MTIQIQKTEAYSCPICSSLFLSQEKAETCNKKCEKKEKSLAKKKVLEDKRKIYRKELEDKEMMICNEAESLEDIKNLFEKYAKEHLGVQLRFTMFDFVFTDRVHSSSRAYHAKEKAGFDGRIEGTIKSTQNSKNRYLSGGDFFDINRSFKEHYIASFPEIPKEKPSAFDTTLPFHFKGIYTGTGGGGDSTFQYSASILLDDFPKIKAKYEEYKKLEEKNLKFKTKTEEIKTKYNTKIKETKEIVELTKLNQILNAEIRKTEQEISDTVSELNKKYQPAIDTEIATFSQKIDFKEEDFRKLATIFKKSRY